MTEEYWASSPFSVARYYGSIKIRGVEYVIVNKEGKDIYECSIEAEKAGREKAIEPGEPADLVDRRYVPMYKRLGRDQFIEWVKEGLDLTAMKKRLKEEKK
jgi:hypothetical protein